MVGDLAAASGTVRARREGTFGVVPAAATTSLSMVLTELCQNAIEHGLNSSSGEIVVRPEREEKLLTVSVLDDGAGLPEGFMLGNQTSLGLSIISALMREMNGTLEITARNDQPGTAAIIRLPL